MWYQRIVEIDTPQEALITSPKIQLGKRRRKAMPASSRKKSKESLVEGLNYGAEEAAEDDDEDEDEIHQFRRVHVVHKNLVPISPLQHMRRNYSMTMADSVPSESGSLAGVTGSQTAANVVFPKSPGSSPGLPAQEYEHRMQPDKPIKSEKSKVKLFSRPGKIGISKDKEAKAPFYSKSGMWHLGDHPNSASSSGSEGLPASMSYQYPLSNPGLESSSNLIPSFHHPSLDHAQTPPPVPPKQPNGPLQRGAIQLTGEPSQEQSHPSSFYRKTTMVKHQRRSHQRGVHSSELDDGYTSDSDSGESPSTPQHSSQMQWPQSVQVVRAFKQQ
jgi:hypothetical protein